MVSHGEPQSEISCKLWRVIRSEGEMWEPLRKSKCEVKQLGIRDQQSAQATRCLGRTGSPLPPVEMY